MENCSLATRFFHQHNKWWWHMRVFLFSPKGNQESLAQTHRYQALLVLKDNKEPRDLKEPKEKKDKTELDSLGWSMFGGEGPHVPVVFRFFIKVYKSLNKAIERFLSPGILWKKLIASVENSSWPKQLHLLCFMFWCLWENSWSLKVSFLYSYNNKSQESWGVENELRKRNTNQKELLISLKIDWMKT